MTDTAVRVPVVRYQAELVEAVVQRELARRWQAGERHWHERYRKAADRLYVLHPEPAARAAAFHRLHAGLFDELGCGRPVVQALERARVPATVVLVARARTPDEEEADLTDEGATLGLRIMAERFGTPDLERLLDHELGHVADIVDPVFEYGRAAIGGPVAQGLVGARFGLLWDCVVDGRTARAGRTPLRTRQEYDTALPRLFPQVPSAAAAVVVGRLWDGMRPTFDELVRFAVDPHALARWSGVHLDQDEGPGGWSGPGAPCPLCRFPTHAWASPVPEGIVALIATDFPGWSPAEGACERCVERYAVAAELGGAL
ncbi:MAG: hypothetical protein QN203_00125 [Armatimonadota bacterium]|nr:hypothetical protein [Armatimonadota bacterium]MDR7486307.1 hypothetical protein [Armatimonadota bacterium]MDR7532282.1 hypothetical protein [Armatimonadota bacterium]